MDVCLFVRFLIFPQNFVHVQKNETQPPNQPRTCPFSWRFGLAPFKLLQILSCLNYRGIAIYNNDGQVDSWQSWQLPDG